MKTRKGKMKIILALSVIGVIFSGCIGQLSEEEQAQWFTIADPIAENILQTINNDDYQRHIKDYSQEMIDATPPEAFTQLRDLLLSKIGKYISKAPDKAVEDGDYIVVFYSAKFEQEDNVTVRVVFKKGDDTHQVYGLWFDSPKLRE